MHDPILTDANPAGDTRILAPRDRSLVAARVSKPATLAVRSPHASTNELATAIGVDHV